MSDTATSEVLPDAPVPAEGEQPAEDSGPVEAVTYEKFTDEQKEQVKDQRLMQAENQHYVALLEVAIAEAQGEAEAIRQARRQVRLFEKQIEAIRSF